MTDYEAAFHTLTDKWHESVKHYEDRIEKLEAALRDLLDGWECCAVSKAMRRVAREALEGKDD